MCGERKVSPLLWLGEGVSGTNLAHVGERTESGESSSSIVGLDMMVVGRGQLPRLRIVANESPHPHLVVVPSIVEGTGLSPSESRSLRV